jgi:hypothetical protein
MRRRQRDRNPGGRGRDGLSAVGGGVGTRREGLRSGRAPDRLRGPKRRADEALGYCVDLGLAVPKTTPFETDPEVKRERIWSGPQLRPASARRPGRGPRPGPGAGRRCPVRSGPPRASSVSSPSRRGHPGCSRRTTRSSPGASPTSSAPTPSPGTDPRSRPRRRSSPPTARDWRRRSPPCPGWTGRPSAGPSTSPFPAPASRSPGGAGGSTCGGTDRRGAGHWTQRSAPTAPALPAPGRCAPHPRPPRLLVLNEPETSLHPAWSARPHPSSPKRPPPPRSWS